MDVSISIILLSFNRPDFVLEAVNSVLWQTFKDFELLIVENSTDNITRQVLETYNDKRIKMCYENPTPEERRAQCIISVLNNKYMDIAQGKYIFFFCDDDILLPNCLEEHFKFAEAHGECNCHSGQLWLKYQDGRWFFGSVHEFPDTIFDAQNSPSCKLTGGAVLVRKEFLKDIGQPYFRQLDSHHCATADAVFFEDMAKKHPFLPINQTLSIARFHPNHRSFEYWRHD